jgi:hypothetical protein
LSVARRVLVELLLGLEPPQRRVHVLLTVETRDDLLGLLATVLHEQPRGALDGHGGRQYYEDDGQHDGEAGHVAPSPLSAKKKQMAGTRMPSGGDLPAQAQVSAKVRRRQLVHVRANGAGGGARGDAGETARPTANGQTLETEAWITAPPIIVTDRVFRGHETCSDCRVNVEAG